MLQHHDSTVTNPTARFGEQSPPAALWGRPCLLPVILGKETVLIIKVTYPGFSTNKLFDQRHYRISLNLSFQTLKWGDKTYPRIC